MRQSNCKQYEIIDTVWAKYDKFYLLPIILILNINYQCKLDVIFDVLKLKPYATKIHIKSAQNNGFSLTNILFDI